MLKFKTIICAICMALIVVTMPMTTYAYGNSSTPTDLYTRFEDFPLRYKFYAYYQCKINDLSYPMFLAVAYNESRFTVTAEYLNKDGTIDRGLCQINDACFDFLNRQEILDNSQQLFNPYVNIDCYITLMKYHKEYTHDDDKALLRYQVGEGAYKRRYTNGELTNSTHQRVLNYKDAYCTYLDNNQILLDILNSYPEASVDNRFQKMKHRYEMVSNYDIKKGIGEFNGTSILQPLW